MSECKCRFSNRQLFTKFVAVKVVLTNKRSTTTKFTKLKSHKVCCLHFPSGKKVLGALPTSSLFSNRKTCNSKSGRNVEQMKTVKQEAHSKMCEQIKVPVVKFQR